MELVKKVPAVVLLAAMLAGGMATPTYAAPIDDAREIAQFVLTGLKAGGGLGGLSPRERARLFSEGILKQLKERGLTVLPEDVAQVIYDEGKSVGVTPKLAVESTLFSLDGKYTGEFNIIVETGETAKFTVGDDVITGEEGPTSP